MTRSVPINEKTLRRFEDLFIPEPNSGCWLWTGSLMDNGYGQFSVGKSDSRVAHRVSWTLYRGPIPDEALVCHHCDIRPCVNPDHLYVGNYVSNRQDMLARNRWSHPFGQRDACSNGHPYEVYGYRICADGSRACRECSRIHTANYRKRIKGEL